VCSVRSGAFEPDGGLLVHRSQCGTWGIPACAAERWLQRRRGHLIFSASRAQAGNEALPACAAQGPWEVQGSGSEESLMLGLAAQFDAGPNVDAVAGPNVEAGAVG